VILIDFTPNQRYIGDEPHENGYYKSLYEKFYFSSDYWKGTSPNTPHPDGHDLFGSVNDYYYDQSYGNVSIVGKNGQSLIINDADPENTLVPLWLELPESIQYYGNTANFKHRYYLAAHFFDKAVEEYGSALIESFDGLVFIFGGKEGTSGNLASGFTWPSSWWGFPETNVKGVIVIGEKNINRSHNGLNHIGGHVHELGHLIGLSDEYEGTLSPGAWAIMADGTGNKSGPLFTSNCPAPFSPIHKLFLHWDTPILLTESSGEVEILRDTNRPFLYKVEIPNTDEYFVIEKRDGSGFEAYTPNEIIGQGNWEGVLIWHGKPGSVFDKVGTTYSERNIIIKNERNIGPVRVDNFIEIDDPTPAKPVNFAVGGSVGQHPVLTWNANTELDLNGYKIYVRYGSGNYGYLTSVDKYTTSFTDPGVIIGGGKFALRVSYKITSYDVGNNESDYTFPRCVNASGLSKIGLLSNTETIPEKFNLYPAMPNPFNPSATIRFDLPEESKVKIEVFDLQGKLIRELSNKTYQASSSKIVFDGTGLSSGIYIYKITAVGIESGKSFTDVKRMTLIK
jgi:M6 family metalloprotease-like protein